MSSGNNVPAAAAPFSLTWGESPALYLSYGTAALKGARPSLTDAVAAMKSFTAMSPPMGLDYFAVFDGRRLAAAAVAEHLPARMADAIAEQVADELASENPRFLAAPSDVVEWWRTVVQTAFRAVVLEEVAGGESSDAGEGAAAVGAVVALVMEKYIVVASYGACKAVLCRGGGQHVELTRECRSAEVIDLNSEPANSFILDTSLASGSGSSVHATAVVIPELADKADEKQAAEVIDLDSEPDEKKAVGVIDLNSEPDEKKAVGVIDLNSEPDGNFVLETTVTSASGSSSLPAVVIPELDVVVVERQAQDEFLILASGGLWGPVAPAPACAFVRQRLGVTSLITMHWEAPVDIRGSPDMLARELANKALHAGTKDNVSVAIILFRDFWGQSHGGEVPGAPTI